ncbi:MAG TPA: cupin domain-containing protein [Gemmatimonadaceae bacterium]|nr:cupin domain-containing protein [Gemmatimonadaceae bacterium]
MRRLTPLVSAALVVTALAGARALPAQGASPTAHALKWGPAPAALPPGAKIAVVDGDPTKSGPFTIHVMMPSHYRIAPHSHPTDETITVLRGTFRYGMGDKWDTKAMHALPHGGSGTMKAGENHYAATTGRTEISIQSTGPFEINYVNPKDDPRNKKGNKPKV